jgi:hypothetical protein
MRYLKFLPFVWLMVTCRSNETETVSSAAKSYLNEILSIMQTNSINRNTIDWNKFKQDVFNQAGNAQTIADTYDAIQYALISLGDHHSFYMKAHGGYLYNNSPSTCGGSTQSDVTPPDSIGYIRIKGFTPSPQSTDAIQFAQSIQDAIKSRDRSYLKGWLVDLRGNTGGDMWPMIAGIGPIVGSGVLGYFIDSYGHSTTWIYSNGTSSIDGSNLTTVTTPYTLLNPQPKVAVLIDGLTASSGEAVAVAFEGRPNTKFFGASPSCGLSTANSSYTLSDGAQLYLTVAEEADRNNVKHGNSITPDVLTASPADAVTAAINWLFTK